MNTSQLIQNIKNIFQNNSVLTEKSSTTEDLNTIIKSLQVFDQSVKDAYATFFNDLNLGTNGDGINLIKGNSFCELIPQEYVYSEIRKFLWEKLPLYHNGPKFFLIIQDNINVFEEYIIQIESQYKEYQQNPPTSNDPGVPPTQPSIDEFWNIYNIESTYQNKLTILQTSIEHQNQLIESFENLINQWLDLGLNSAISVSIALSINGFDRININNNDNLFEILGNNLSLVSQYSNKLTSSYELVLKIKNDSNIPDNEKANEIKKEVLNILQVKNTSQNILQQMDQFFQNNVES